MTNLSSLLATEPTPTISPFDAALVCRYREALREMQAVLDRFYEATRGYTEGEPAEVFERQRQEIERMRAVCIAAKRWKAVADTPGASVWRYTERLDAAIDALVRSESPRRG